MAEACGLPDHPGSMKQAHPPTPEEIGKVLKESRILAVIGLSEDPSKTAYGVSAYLKEQGYAIVPVHPTAATALGGKAYRSVSEIPGPVDLVYMFRRADAAPAVMDEAVAKGVKAVWMPEGVVHEGAAAKGRAAGLVVIMDRCARKEHARLYSA